MKKQMAGQLRYAVLLAALILVGCSTAPRIVGPVHPAIRPSAVTIYEPPLVPRHYTVVAKLNTMDYGGFSSPRMDRILRQKMREQAAQLGANGVLLIRSGGGGAFCATAPCCAMAPCTAGRPQAHAEAIYVPH